MQYVLKWEPSAVFLGEVVVVGCQENESCSKVLNFLEKLDDRIRCTHEEAIAVVEP